MVAYMLADVHKRKSECDTCADNGMERLECGVVVECARRMRDRTESSMEHESIFACEKQGQDVVCGNMHVRKKMVDCGVLWHEVQDLRNVGRCHTACG